jgi:hypothetical protein
MMDSRNAIAGNIASILCLMAVLATMGCGGVDSYLVDPDEASAAALEQYDKNGDGQLDEAELKACPALLGALGAYDETNDKKLSKEEIAAQIDYMYQRGSGLVSIDCLVTLDGAPLSGATVKFIPEKFLGDEIKPAEGITNSGGNASMSIAADELPKELRRHSFMRTGIYRVEITHPTRKIPAKYKTNTELGFEFHETNHIQPPEFHLKSK